MNMKEVSERLAVIRSIVPTQINPKLKYFHSNIPFRISCIRDALLQRLLNLGEESVQLHGSEALIPFLLTVRACVETAALIFSLNRYMESALQSGDLGELADQLEKATLGSRNASTTITAVNILNSIDKLERNFPGIRKQYDDLSEYCHPNFEGVLCSYSELSEENNFTFRLQSERVKLGESPLKVALIVGLASYDEARQNYKKIIEQFFA